ncbi:MAG TPA: zf-HC2 domain-containing protein [Pyrinomonadaceae bacterium]|nr:zf-HC2 domain-containing protein [Pyrinomonadaceae bacterium]
MNCEKCQGLISDFVDGSLSQDEQNTLSEHLDECLGCADVRNDLQSIISFCQSERGQYAAPPNERALWLRIRNVIEADTASAFVMPALPRRNWTAWIGKTWELSFPQLAAATAAIVLVVSLSTVVGLRRWQSNPVNGVGGPGFDTLSVATENLRSRISQQQQAISYWNQRVEYNKARWSPQMRETFDRNLKVIDDTVNASFENLSRDPHDEVSEEMLNAALNEKLSLLREFGEL